MLDLTSALYLGFNHAKSELSFWDQLTIGKPAALEEAPAAKSIASFIAQMQGLESGLLGPSSLHFFWDLFGMFDPKGFTIFYDKQLYPVGQVGIERTKGKGLQQIPFAHLSAESLGKAIRDKAHNRKRPVVVTDGWCPRCGNAAPLPNYMKWIRARNGLLIIDDTQGFGILGQQPDRWQPFGCGGGGILPWWNLKGPDIITITSLAKAFGVPVAALCGSEKWVRSIARKSVTRLNNSPVSNAHLAAAKQALALNACCGEQRRQRLQQHIRFFRNLMHAHGWRLSGGDFPVQTLSCKNPMETMRWHKYLQRAGIQTVVVSPHLGRSSALLLIIRADHSKRELVHVARQLRKIKTMSYDPIR